MLKQYLFFLNLKEINREFKKQGIQEEAHMACEYVVKLKDENWRTAIEAFLGVHRYAVLVPGETFDLANAVFDRSKHRYVELVNTKRLMAKTMDCAEDSVFHYLQIQNETAWLSISSSFCLSKIRFSINLSRHFCISAFNKSIHLCFSPAWLCS